MKWADELTVKEHFSFMKELGRSAKDLESVLSAYEADQLYDIVRLTPDQDIFSIGERDDVYGVMFKMYEVRVRVLAAREEKPKDREVTGENFRPSLNFALTGTINNVDDFTSYMAYCEYIALRKEGQHDVMNSTWEEWQELITVKIAIESFYNKVSDERLEHWRKMLDVELQQAKYEEENPIENEPEETETDIPLENR